MGADAYYHNKERAKKLFIQGIHLARNPDNMPKWRLETRLGKIIADLSELGYITTIDGLKPKSEGGYIKELPDLKLYYEFADVLGMKVVEFKYPNKYFIELRLSKLGLGMTCRTCNGSGLYKLVSGSYVSCASCTEGLRVKINMKTLERLKKLLNKGY